MTSARLAHKVEGTFIDRMTPGARLSGYVHSRMNEWRMGEQSRRMQTCLRRVLNELVDEALLTLKDPKLEVMLLPEADFSVWAYFPIHGNRLIARRLRPKPQTRVLLVLSTAAFGKEPVEMLEDGLRDHFGHVLLYLRSPKARNECADAQREWRSSRSFPFGKNRAGRQRRELSE